jgi:peptide-methionine (S)-S-oxide reductase
MIRLAGFLVILLATACKTTQTATLEGSSKATTNTVTTMTNSVTTEIATLGGGCFWCIETLYQDLKGVTKVESGYSGGFVKNPSYRAVCDGTTGHTEVIQVSFDPAIISYRDIVDIFFTIHDPTTLNRQGNDVGTQYRSAIYFHSEQQEAIAKEAKQTATAIWDDPIVTEITKFDEFYKAEDYHQNYYKDNPTQGYCRVIIAPKVKKFREKYYNRLKEQP